MKRFLLIAIVAILAIGLIACSAPAAETSSEAPASVAPASEAPASEAPAEKLTFGYITPGPDTWYKRDVEGFQYAAEKIGAEVIVLNSDYDVEKEIANIDSLINQGVDGMCIFSFNLSGANLAAQKCEAAGIPLVVTDNVGEVLKTEDSVVACIDFDWKAMGKATAEYVLKTWPGEKVAMVTGMFETAPVQHFRSTFESTMKDAGLEVVAVRDGMYNPEEAVNQAQDLIESGYDFSVLFVGDEDMGAAVMRMLDTKGLLNNPIEVMIPRATATGIFTP